MINENATTILETKYGDFNVTYFDYAGVQGVSMHMGSVRTGKPLVRVHSSCLFSEALCAIDCDCKLQLDAAIEMISDEGQGILLYLYQEGRGIGLENKIRAVEVMRTEGCDTAEAFKKLGLELDPRKYECVSYVLRNMNASKTIRLMSNNPRKASALEEAGFNVVETIPLSYDVNETTKKYLQSKQEKLGHHIEWSKIGSSR